jgi:hypothetical protein
MQCEALEPRDSPADAQDHLGNGFPVGDDGQQLPALSSPTTTRQRKLEQTYQGGR